jgi:hypothetical protein
MRLVRQLRQVGSAVVLAMALLALTVSTAFAAAPHFISASAAFAGSGPNLNVSFKESGLGDNQNITYVATADGTAVYACINGGGNHPKASNKETVSGPVSATGTFSSGKNGTISQTLTLHPPSAGNFSCPSGQKLVIAFVSYSNVAITDTTNGVTEAISGTFSRCLFDSGLGLCP